MGDYKERNAREDAAVREWFTEHVATYRVCGDATPDSPFFRTEEMAWKRPDSGTYGVRYIIAGPTLFVQGDLGHAVYRWSEAMSFPSIAGCDLQYFHGKCQASEFGREYLTWDEDEALDYFTEITTERIADAAASRQGEIRALTEGGKFAIRGGRNEYQEWLQGGDARLVLGNDFWEYGSIGMVIDRRCRAHLIGVKMAVEQLGLATP